MKIKKSQYELDLDQPWRIGEASFVYIVCLLKQIKAKRVLEFGSGASSVRLAIEMPETEIIAIEHDKHFYRATTELARRWNVKRNLSIIYLPLEFQWFGLCRYFSYRKRDFDSSYDCIIIDGPPYYTLRGREACLYQVYNNIRKDGLIILDDYKRGEEKSIVENWLMTYPRSFEFREITSDDHLAVLRKIDSEKPRWLLCRKIHDNISTNSYFIRQQLSDCLPDAVQRLLKALKGFFAK